MGLNIDYVNELEYCPYLYQNMQNKEEYICDLGAAQVCLNWKKRDPNTMKHVYTECFICPLKVGNGEK